MQREEKHLKILLEIVLSRLNDMKLSIGAMIYKLETEYETINWSSFLDNFALISSHLTGLSKIIAKELGAPLRNRTVRPLNLSPERDNALWQLTEDSVPVFSHDIVPDYLRTKPEPAAEQRMLQHEQKANNLSSESAIKLVAQYNKVVTHVFAMVNKAKEEWEVESSSKSGVQQMSSMANTQALVADLSMGKAMAFYSVRLDEEGKEIETFRRTFRKLRQDTQRKIGKVAPSNVAEEQLINNANSTANNYKTVTYVNSATFIEKDLGITRRKLPTEKYEYEYENDKDSDSNSSRSNCNCDEPKDQQYQTHISQDAIPLLELNSNESFPSSNTMSYSYRNVCEVAKMIQKPDAYREWLDAKRTAKYYEIKKKQEKEREAQKKSQHRRDLAQQKYKEWMVRKNKQLKQEKESKETKNTNDPQQFETEPKNNESEQLAKQRNFQAWLKKKLKQEKEFKEKVNEELRLEMQLEQIRRQKAEEIYKDWLQTAIYKPKPVPLNRGLFTLKGSISSLYINPVSWVFLDTTESSMNL